MTPLQKKHVQNVNEIRELLGLSKNTNKVFIIYMGGSGLVSCLIFIYLHLAQA